MTAAATRVGAITAALIGNPNCGKTTVFNALTGLRQSVGNYPGVTVERRSGRATGAAGESLDVIDLPGTYSLANRSPDEEVAVDVILGRLAGEAKPDVLLNVCDASNLARNLFLTTQLLELETPVVVILNMVDVAQRNGRSPDPKALERLLGVPVVALAGHDRAALVALFEATKRAIGAGPTRRIIDFPPALLGMVGPDAGPAPAAEPFGVRLRSVLADDAPVDLRDRLESAGIISHEIEASCRYAWIDKNLESVFGGAAKPAVRTSLSERVDSVLLHRVGGPLFFVLVMGVVFQAIFTWAEQPQAWFEAGAAALASMVSSWIGPGDFRDLVVDGAMTGTLNVLIFLPQIVLLFLAIGLLEDSGYMARVAVIVDRVMRMVGLHGKSFVPMLSSFACAVPGIMATRSIESRSARLVTILVAPLMSCSARLPVYTLLIGAFFGDQRLAFGISAAAVLMIGLYVLGMAAAVVMAFIFRRTIVRGDAPTLILELPPYRRPVLGTVLRHVYERSWLFVRRAGTVILGLSIILWFLQRFPADPAIEAHFQSETTRLEALLSRTDLAAADRLAATTEVSGLADRQAAELLRTSWAGRMGHAVEPLIAPLGFDWRIGIGLVASFAAREVLVSSLATVFGTAQADEDLVPLQETLRNVRAEDGDRPAYRPLTALSLLVFFVLACQCMSTLAVVRRETGGWRWPVFMFGYMTALAWSASFAVYGVGSALGY